MAHHVEHMDVDPIDSDFDKENAYHYGNVLLQASSIEKGYEEMDVSDLNIRLKYPFTPNSSQMSKSLTANCTDNKNSDLQDDFSNISRSLNSSMTKSDKQKIPLQVIPPEQFAERNLSVLHPINSTGTIEESNVTVKVIGASEAEEDMSLPSSAASTNAHTPEATTPTKESPKNSDSSIIRGLKSVFNMFRPSQSPIPSGDEGKSEEVPMDISQQIDHTDVSYKPVIASTPLPTHKSESCSSKRNSPHKESLIFNNDLEKELKWNDDNVFFNFKEKVPVFPLHTQLFENKAKSCTNVKNNENINTEEVLDKTVDISNNTIIGEGTMNDQTVSDSEFLDCETTFTKNDFQSIEENANVKTKLDIQNGNKTSIPDITNETMTIKIENNKQKEINSNNDNVINTESKSNIDSTTINAVSQTLHKESTLSESFQQEYKTNFTSEIHQETPEINNRSKNEQEQGHNSSYLQAYNDLNKVLTNEDCTKCKIDQEFKKSENEMLGIENETNLIPAVVPLPDINDLSLSHGENMDVTNRSLSEVISDVENLMNSQNDDSLIKETSEIKSNLIYNNILLLSTESKDCATTVREEIKSNNIEDQITDNIDTSVLKCIEEEITNINIVETQNVDFGDMNISKMKEQYFLNENETYGEESGVNQNNDTSTVSNQVANITENETELAYTLSVVSKSKKPEEEENKDTVSISVNKEFNLESATETPMQDKSFVSELQNKIVSQNSKINSPTSVEFASKEISTHNMVSHINDKLEDNVSKNVLIVNDTLLTDEQLSIQSNDIDNEIPKDKTEEVINKVGSQPLFNIKNDEEIPEAVINKVISSTNTEKVDAELTIKDKQEFFNLPAAEPLPIHDVIVPVNIEGNVIVEVSEENEESSDTTMLKNDAQLCIEVIKNNDEYFIDNEKVEVLNEQITTPENSKVDELENISSGVSATEVGIIADEKSQEKTETQTNITLSSPPSPKIISAGQYNFNFDVIDDPFATKTKIRMSPPPNASFSKTNLFNERTNIEEIKNDISKNRRKSQPARKRAVGNTKKMNRTFDGVSSRPNVHINLNENNEKNVPQDLTRCTDSTSKISKVNMETLHNKGVSQILSEKNDAKVFEILSKSFTKNVNNMDMSDEHLMEATENTIVIDKDMKTSPILKEMEHLPSQEDTEFNKHKKSEVSAMPNDLKPLSGDIIAENNSDVNIEIEPRISKEEKLAPLNGKQTIENVSSSEQSDYYSAGTSTENMISKSVFNLPEIDDKNFNFSKKPKTCQSSTEISTENLLGTGSEIVNPIASSDKVSDMEPLNGEEHIVVNADSSNSCDENCTIREVHTEDEDTVEGPFLETGDYDDSAIESDKRDFIQINNVTTQETESDEMFIDAEAFEFLMNQNNENQVADSGKESLFLKFDPLFTRKITSEGVAAALNKMKNSTPNKTLLRQRKDPMFTARCSNLKSNPDPFSVNNSLDCIEDPNGTIKPVMAVTPAVNPVVAPKNNLVTPPRNNRQSMTFTSPAMAVIDRLLSINSNNSMVDHDTSFPYSAEQSQAGLALTQLRELLAEKEVHVHQLRTESRDLKDRLDTLESQMRSLEVESETRLRRVNELNERLVEKTNMNKSMASVVEEYEKTIASLIAETEEERRSRAEERVKLIKEKDEQTTHLASMEAAFSDLHSKYEKSKQIICNYKTNEDKCKASLKEFEDSLVKMQNNYDSLKSHATTQLNHANQELEKLNRTHQAEVLKLNALIKRRDLHISSLEETLAQKTKANEELTAICDDLINKVG